MFVRFLRGLFALLLFYSAYIKTAAADPAATFNEGPIAVEVHKKSTSSGEAVDLKVKVSNHKKSTVFSLENPARVVIDLHGIKIKKNKGYAIKGLPFISGIRFGYHADKARIVLDLISALPHYKWSEKAGVLTISFSPPNGEPEIVAEQSAPRQITPQPTAVTTISPDITPTPELTPSAAVTKRAEKLDRELDTIEELLPSREPKQEPAPTPAPSATLTPIPTIDTPTPAPTISPTSEPSATPAATPIESATPAATELPTTQALKDITFDYKDGERPIVKIVLSKKAEFEVQKKGAKDYLLKIKNCRELKPELKLPQFPPHDFAGFTMIQAEPVDKDIDIKIGVERNERITATPNENEIHISILQEEKPAAANRQQPAQRAVSAPRR